MSGCRVIHGDCRDTMREMPENSVDAVVTDSPYGLSREPDMAEVLRHWLAGDDYKHSSSGFMGAAWDSFVPGPATWREAIRVLKPGGFCLSFFGDRTYDMGVTAMRLAGFEIRTMQVWLHGQGFPKTDNALKPALEPIIVARKPLSEKTVAANVLRWGTGALNIDGCRVTTEDSTSRTVRGGGANVEQWRMGKGDQQTGGSPLGRWPANLIHDGSQGVLELFPASRSAGQYPSASLARDGATDFAPSQGRLYADTGSAARFYPSFPPDDAPPARYCAKASKADRVSRCTSCGWRTMGRPPSACPSCGASGDGTWSGHPTVKPLALMRWLCRLVTPSGGTVLDPFAGSGTTLAAALAEGFDVIGIEREAEFVADIHARLRTVAPNLQAAE